MSLGGADAKFPNQSTEAIPPSPSRENPGQVYPKSDPNAAPAESVPGTGGDYTPAFVVGNPFSLERGFSKLDSALSEIISSLEGEESRVGSSATEEFLVAKFKSWQEELVALRGGAAGFSGTTRAHAGTPQKGGLFTD
ncbi:hypothetical protein BDY19DRAFT_590644 [Irpex rosettiformis]|uniref:Uncharacterized protein n=1 Tax=Irpex rosettiformis TaxID=378272 RepID=A0ACB8UDC0_9APHY|nr:hypothetical protein BDY19DRAFT_590644 [Irpex rosettiformis]